MNQEKQIKQLVAAFETELRRTVEQFENDGLNYVNGFSRIGKIRLVVRSNQPSNQLHVYTGVTLDLHESPEFREPLLKPTEKKHGRRQKRQHARSV